MSICKRWYSSSRCQSCCKSRPDRLGNALHLLGALLAALVVLLFVCKLHASHALLCSERIVHDNTFVRVLRLQLHDCIAVLIPCAPSSKQAYKDRKCMSIDLLLHVDAVACCPPSPIRLHPSASLCAAARAGLAMSSHMGHLQSATTADFRMMTI